MCPLRQGLMLRHSQIWATLVGNNHSTFCYNHEAPPHKHSPNVAWIE